MPHNVSLFSRFSALPTWAKWTIALALFSLLGGLQSAWGQRYLISEFSLGTIAFAIHYLSIGTSIWAGYAAGSRINTRARFWKWTVGIVACTIAYVGWFFATNWIPGIGWRLEAIMNAETIIEDWV